MSDPKVKVRIDADGSGARREFESVGATAVTVANSVRTAWVNVSAVAATLAGGAFIAGVKAQIDMMDASRKAAQAAGVSVQAMDELTYAGKLADVSQEQLGKSLAKLAGQMVKVAAGDEPLKRLFEQTLGVKVRDATGKLRETDKVLEDLAERFESMEDGPKKTALAVELFGEKLGPRLIPFLNQGKQGIQALREELRKLKGVMSDEDAAAAEQLNDNFTRLGVAGQAFGRQVATAVLPTLVEFSEFAVQASKDVGVLGAAWLTFGKAVARVTGQDEIGQAKTRYEQLSNAAALAAVRLRTFTGYLSARPDDSQILAQVVKLREELERAQRAALLASNDIARLMSPSGQKDAGAGRGFVGPAAAVKKQAFDPDAALITTSAPKAASRVSGWEADLAEARLQVQEKARVNNTFRDLDKADEAAYWELILAQQKLTAEEQLAVRRKVAEANLAIHKESFESHVASLRAESETMRQDYASRVLIAEETYALIASKHGLESKEAIKANADVLEARRKLEDQQRKVIEIGAEVRRADEMAAVESAQRAADLSYSIGLITQQQLLAIRAQHLAEKERIEVEAKASQLAAMKDGAEDPEAYARLQAELAAIRRRYRIEGEQVAGEQVKAKAEGDPMQAIFGASQQAIQQGLDSMVTHMQITLGGLRNVARNIGKVLIEELVTKKVAAWIAGEAKMLLIQAVYGKQRVAQEAVTAGEVGAIQSSLSLANIGKIAVEAAANAYKSIAAIPVVGPFLAPAAAAAALVGVVSLGRRIFSAERGFDIPAGVNPMVQTHQREMILPATLADTVRDMANVYSSGGGGGGRAGNMPVQLNATPLKGGFWVVHQDEFLGMARHAQRTFAVR